jgi:hypothetical protein
MSRGNLRSCFGTKPLYSKAKLGAVQSDKNLSCHERAAEPAHESGLFETPMWYPAFEGSGLT